VVFICSEGLSSACAILLPTTDVALSTASRPGSSSPPYVPLACWIVSAFVGRVLVGRTVVSYTSNRSWIRLCFVL